jgi:hypothetical protein
MKYNLISADEIVRRLDNDFNINHSDFLVRIPQWIYQSLRDIDYINSFVPSSLLSSVSNYRCNLPQDLYELSGIEYNHRRLIRTNYPVSKNNISNFSDPIIISNIGVTVYGSTSDIRITEELTEELKNIEVDINTMRSFEAFTILNAPTSVESYSLLNGYIETSFEEGYIWYHYYKLPEHYNELLGSFCPYIPDNEKVIEFITSTCIKYILQRGFKHPVFSLESNNPYTNIGIITKQLKKEARNSLNKWDKDESEKIIRLMNNSLYNQIIG